jgi:hypothetical protein
LLGCADDDLKILFSKNFIIPFETGVCVIKHWRIHNLIQKDRYKPTVYDELKSKLSLKNNNVYTLDTGCIQPVPKVEPQVSIGKVSLVEDSLKKPTRKNALVNENDFETFWSAYPVKVGKDKALESWKKKKPRIDDVMFSLSWQIDSDKWKKGYIPNPATYLNQGRWKDEQPAIEEPF